MMSERNLKYAVILCGGRGSRLGNFTEKVPKPLVAVGGKPILDYIFKNLIKYGFNRIILPSGYLGKQIKQYTENYPFPTGTECYVLNTGLETPIGGRLAQVQHLFPACVDFLLCNGDLIFDFDLKEMLHFHLSKKKDITFASATIKSPFGLLTLKGGILTGFSRDEEISSFNGCDSSAIGLIYSGICIMNTAVFDKKNIEECENFEAEVFPEIIKSGRTEVFMINGLWHPVETPKDITSINLILKGMTGGNL